MHADWHRSIGLRRGLLSLLVVGTAGGCCTRPHWYQTFAEDVNHVQPLPQKYAQRKLKSGYLDRQTCTELCGGSVEDCHLADVAYAGVKTGKVAVCHYAGMERCWADGLGRMPSGRRPAGLDEGPTSSRLAELARLEAASVVAFERLAADLAAHGAPAALIKRAHRAAADERRHARAVAELAGIAAVEVEVADPGPRSLYEIALENAVEGCVNESFGALLAWHQARHAEHPAARRVFARIAPDETAHGALAWAVHRWADAQLGELERAALATAMQSAAHALASPPAFDPESQALGLPAPDAWQRLGTAFAAAVS